VYGAVITQSIQLVSSIKEKLATDAVLGAFIGINGKEQINSLLTDLKQYMIAVDQLIDYGSDVNKLPKIIDPDHVQDLRKISLELASSIDALFGDTNARTFDVVRNLVPKLTEIVQNGIRTNLLDRWSIVPLVRDVVPRLQLAMSQIVPTSTSLSHTWSTQLHPPPPNPDSFFSFEMTSPGATSTPCPSDFCLESKINIDFVSGRRTWETISRLQPFAVTVNLNSQKLIKVYFNGATFTASQGSEPRTDVVFKNVEFGPALTFLQKLQQLLSPKEGSGPYVIATAQDITAGYRFDAGIIQVGTLQFLNVALHVFMTLPFRGSSGNTDDLAAEIGFGFGSAERPFLIAQPPYGGGGYVELTYQHNRLRPSISLSFGAVVGIHFGPLNGWGRITSTITWGNSRLHPGKQVIRASVEAVGEGHIGCFGLAVMMQIGLEQVEGGSLTGFANYSFSFSVGFLSVTFSFSVTWTIAGSSSDTAELNEPDWINRSDKPQYAALNMPTFTTVSLDAGQPANPDNTGACSGTHTISISAPDKMTSWKQYKARLSMELLD
jgi:hypothetical protein